MIKTDRNFYWLLFKSTFILFVGTPRELFAREEILSHAGLEPPPITQLLRTLKTDEQALTLDEAEKIILSKERNLF